MRTVNIFYKLDILCSVDLVGETELETFLPEVIVEGFALVTSSCIDPCYLSVSRVLQGGMGTLRVNGTLSSLVHDLSRSVWW